MPMQLQGQTAPQTLGDGVAAPFRQGRTGEQIVTELHGKYYESAYRGNVYWATMTAGVIFPAPGATAANPITLTMPAGATRNASLISFDMAVTVIPGTPLTGLYGLYVNNVPQAAAVTGTALAPIAMPLGSTGTPSAKAFTTSTVPVAPTLLRVFGQKVTGQVVTANPSPGLSTFHVDFDGTCILIPGTSITPQQTVADTTNATVICTFVWEEAAV